MGRTDRRSKGAALPPTDDESQQEERLSWLAVAHFKTDDAARGAEVLRSLRRRLIALRTELLDLAEGKQDDSGRGSAHARRNQKHIETLRGVISRAAAAAASERKDKKAFAKVVEKAKLDRLIGPSGWRTQGTSPQRSNWPNPP